MNIKNKIVFFPFKIYKNKKLVSLMTNYLKHYNTIVDINTRHSEYLQVSNDKCYELNFLYYEDCDNSFHKIYKEIYEHSFDLYTDIILFSKPKELGLTKKQINKLDTKEIISYNIHYKDLFDIIIPYKINEDIMNLTCEKIRKYSSINVIGTEKISITRLFDLLISKTETYTRRNYSVIIIDINTIHICSKYYVFLRKFMDDNCECGIILLLDYDDVYIDYFKKYILYENKEEDLLVVGKIKNVEITEVDNRGIIN